MKVFLAALPLLFIASFSSDVSAANWHEISGNKKNDQFYLTCEEGSGWRRCGTEPEPEPQEECKVNGELSKLTMLTYHLKGTPQNGLNYWGIWWDGKKLYDRSEYKLHKMVIGGYQYYGFNTSANGYNGSARRIHNDFPSLPIKNHINAQEFARGEYIAVCRRPI